MLKKFVSFWLIPMNAALTLLVAGLVLLYFPKLSRLGRRLLLAKGLLLGVMAMRQIADHARDQHHEKEFATHRTHPPKPLDTWPVRPGFLPSCPAPTVATVIF